MQNESAKTESFGRSPELVWDTIVRITNGLGSDEAKAIRVLLYLAIIAGKPPVFWRRVKSSIKSFRRLAVSSEKRITPARKGRPLFAFLYDTGANTNNLLPVFQAACGRDWHPNALTGDRVDLNGK